MRSGARDMDTGDWTNGWGRAGTFAKGEFDRGMSIGDGSIATLFEIWPTVDENADTSSRGSTFAWAGDG